MNYRMCDCTILIQHKNHIMSLCINSTIMNKGHTRHFASNNLKQFLDRYGLHKEFHENNNILKPLITTLSSLTISDLQNL